MKIIIILLCVFLFATCYLNHRFPTYHKRKHNKYDVCIVLGSPSSDDGSLSRMQKTRMDRAIELYQKQICSCILISGGSVTNKYGEAETMAAYAESRGIPKSAMLLETCATNTYENLRYAKELCNTHNLHCVIVVTSNFHVRRAAFFTQKFFNDFTMAGTIEKEKFRHYLSEYFRMWNTLYYELRLRKKK